MMCQIALCMKGMSWWFTSLTLCSHTTSALKYTQIHTHSATLAVTTLSNCFHV